MDWTETRELVRLRYELRRLLVERPPGSDEAARTLLRRIEALVAGDSDEAAALRPEIARWQVSLALGR